MFQISADVKLLEERLLRSQIGEIIGYDELSGIIGRDVRARSGGQGWSSLQSARRKAGRDGRAIFGTITKVGLKRLSDPEIVSSGATYVQRAHNMARRGVQQITSVTSYEALPQASKNLHNTYAALLGGLHHMTTATAVKKIEAAVQVANSALPVAKTLRLFLNGDLK